MEGMSLQCLSNKYNRKDSIIIVKLQSLGVYKPKNKRWTKDQIEFLENNYSSLSWSLLMENLCEYSKEEIITKASKLKLKRVSFFWNVQDITILKENYNKVSVARMIDLLGNKFTYSAIITKANKLGIKKIERWTDGEIDFLLENYNKLSLDEIESVLINRNKQSIIKFANNIGLKTKRIWTEEEVQFLTTHYKDLSDIELSESINKNIGSIRDKRCELRLIRDTQKGCYNYLGEYIRKHNNDWKIRSIYNCNAKCVITGKRHDHVHHLYGLNVILKETLNNLGIEARQDFNDYTEDELLIILAEFFKTQEQYPLGVCLTKEVHKTFHDIYGYGNNTPQQFYEFLKLSKTA